MLFLAKLIIPYPVKGFLSAFVIIFIIISRPAHGFTTGALQNRDVMVIFEEPLARVAGEIASLYQILKRDLEESFRWPIDFIPTIVLFNDHSRFQGTVDSDLIVAYAVSDRDLIVIDYSRMTMAPFTIEATLKHELCHLLLHRHIQDENLPKWLDEGVAQWASGGLADIILDKKQSELDKAIHRGRYIPFRSIADNFPTDRTHFILAYEQSQSLIAYMMREYGREALLQVLSCLKDGKNIEEAVQTVYAISFEKLESRWCNNLKNQATWLLILTNNIYEILFSITALALILGFIRVMIRKRAYSRYEEEDDV
ncbi:MAG: hypothetical protein JW932_03540 [Deltaproteobacteria bacterium]|nr:hypothetical protein [Deltaproteobacteria bacterium]